MKLKLFGALTMAALAMLALCQPGWAQNYPTRPVRIVVPYASGAVDTTARIITAQLDQQTGKNFIVDNHPGASGEIGAAIVIKAPADGYTLLLTTDALSLLPSTVKNLPFDVQKDLAPISEIGATDSSFLVANEDFPVHNLQELIAYARDPKNPKIRYGSSGIGSGAHLRMAVFAKSLNLDMIHVPFKGVGDAMTALLGGEVQIEFATAPAALSLIKSGKIRALGYDYPTRASFAPDVPTMVEGGAPPGKVSASWHGLFAPAKTPQPILDYMQDQIRKAVADPATAAKLKANGMNPVGSTEAQFKQTLADSISGMHDAVQAAGVEAQ